MDKNPEMTSSAEFRSFFLKCSMIRLGIMVFLLLLTFSEFFNLTDRGMRFEYYRDVQYIAFFVTGFCLGILYLVLTFRFLGSIVLFRVQILADLFLITWWVILTGGSFSGFSFLYMLALFFYGRMLGMRTIFLSSILVWITIFLISCVQFYFPRYWGEIHVRGSDLAYNFSMLTVALVLINSLVKLSGAQERKLLNRVIEQESVLQRAKELQFRVFDWLDAGLMVVDQQGIITTINQTALVWTSESHRSKIIGRSFVHFFPEFSPFWEDRGQISLRRNTVTSQKRNVIFGFKITQLPAQQGWLILFSDITDVQRLENQVKEMEKLASVGELAAGLAHEMKNPLAGIKASLQLLLSGDMDQEVSDRLARVIVRDIDRLDFLLKDFLIFARPREARPEPLDLGQEIEHVLMSFRLQHPMVRVQVDVGPEPYLFDRDHLHQILINLLGNALQALQGREKPVISIADMRDSGQRKVVVDDNGPGLDPTVRGRCFDPFVTTKALGSGLGLAIARRLAVQNGAFLELLDGPDGGVRAVLTQEQPSGRKGTETQDSP